MARREKSKPQSSLEFLAEKLDQLGLAKERSATILLETLKSHETPEEVIEAINNMVSIAVIETKKSAKRTVQAAIDAL